MRAAKNKEMTTYIETMNKCIYIFNSPRLIYQNSNLTLRLSGIFSIFGLVFFVLNCETMES